MTNKKTKREYFMELRDIVVLREIVVENKDLLKFIDHEIELLDRKNSSKSKAELATEKANAELREKILEVIAQKAMKASEIANILNLTSQKITAQLTKMLKVKQVIRTVDGKDILYIKA